MPNENHDNRTVETAGRAKRRSTRRRKRIAIAALLLLVLLLILNRLVPSPQEELAAFDAARAVPDAENAAISYAELLQGEQVPPDELGEALLPVMTATMDPLSLQESQASGGRLVDLELPDGLLDPNDEEITLLQSWTSAQHPELARWLDTHRNRMDRLQEAASKPACHFPLSPAPGRMSLFDVPLGTFKQHAFLLVRAANRDFGAGDTDAALAKCRTLMTMGRHLSRQPAKHYLLAGIACEAMALRPLAEFIVTGPATDQALGNLAANCGDLDDDWESLSRDISRARSLVLSLRDDPRRFRFRACEWYRRIRCEDEGWGRQRVHELYDRHLCNRRAHRILIELRRFRNRTGNWPQHLEETAASLPPAALIDPQNDGSYAYQTTGDGFRLYSKGPNAQDENALRNPAGPDDWPIWPVSIPGAESER